MGHLPLQYLLPVRLLEISWLALSPAAPSNSVLNLSLFLAFAILYPNYQVMLFFIIPIKVKYLALLDAVYFAVQLIFGSWTVRLAVVVSLLNILLFFGGDFFNTIRRESSYWKTRYNFRKNNRY